jgi:hypothetical protein
MSVEKAKIKIGVATHIGTKLDDMLESAQADVHRSEGAKRVLQQVGQGIGGLLAHVDKDLEEGVLKGMDTPLKVAEVVKRYIQRGAAIAENLAIASEANRLLGMGKVEALQQAVGFVKIVVDKEQSEVDALEEAIRQGSVVVDATTGTASAVWEADPGVQPPSRPMGVHPGDPLASRRSKNRNPHSTSKASRARRT